MKLNFNKISISTFIFISHYFLWMSFGQTIPWDNADLLDSIETKLQEKTAPLPSHTEKGDFLLETKRVTLETQPSSALKDLTTFELNHNDVRYLSHFIVSDIRNLSHIQKKSMTEVILDEFFMHSNPLPFFCKRLKEGKTRIECKNTLRDVLQTHINTTKGQVFLIRSQGDFYGEFEYFSLYLESNKIKNNFLNIFFDVYHEI